MITVATRERAGLVAKGKEAQRYAIRKLRDQR
jgi:hypothetical protein